MTPIALSIGSKLSVGETTRTENTTTPKPIFKILQKKWPLHHNLVPRAIMSFSCRTQPPVMTLVPTYTFVGNLFQAFVMYARVGLRGSRRFGLVLTSTSLCLARNRGRRMFTDMQQIQNVNTVQRWNQICKRGHLRTLLMERSVMETQAIWGHLRILIWSRYPETDRPVYSIVYFPLQPKYRSRYNTWTHWLNKFSAFPLWQNYIHCYKIFALISIIAIGDIFNPL